MSRGRWALCGRRSILETSDVMLRGSRRISDVLPVVFFVNRLVRAAWSGDNVQIQWQAWHVMKIDGSLARNIDFEVGS